MSSRALASFAQCEVASEQLKYYQGSVSDHARLTGMRNLIDHVRLIYAETKKKNSVYPLSLLEPCLKLKRQSIEINIQSASPQLIDQISFGMLAGEYAMMISEWTVAYDFFTRVALRDEKNIEAHRERFKAWTLSMRNRSGVDRLKFYESFKAHVDPIINSPRSRDSEKEGVLWELSLAAKSVDKAPEAAAFWQQILKVNPKHSPSILALGEYFKAIGDNKGVISLYQRHLPLLTKSDDKTAKLYYDWVQALREEKRFGAAFATLKLAKKKFPKNPSIDSVLARILVESGDIKGAEDVLAHSSSASAPNDPDRLFALSRISEFRGDQALKSGQMSQALEGYQTAIQKDPSRGDLRIKAAKVLFDYHKTRKFEATPGMTRDMQLAFQILQPLLSEEKMSADRYGLFIQIGKYAGRSPELLNLCKQFKKTYGRISPKSIEDQCIRSRVAFDQERLAPELLMDLRSPASATKSKSPKSKSAPSALKPR